ncbi:extracellular solute-binding protein [Corticibacterium sp. UT-5YL-CI-8]|nr:extracellular solute-binding protein [Tianweitania sp. UT-5YL-CI-8]
MMNLRMDRRGLLKAGLSTTAILAAPAIISSKALASSGELRLLSFAGMNTGPVLDQFTKDTGIKATLVAISENDDMFAQAKLMRGTPEECDLAEPASTTLPLWYDNELLKPMDPTKLSIGNVTPGMPGTKEGDSGYIDGNLLYASVLWGGEGMGYAKDVKGHGYGEASLADAFNPEFVGQVTVRGHSALAALGRVLDGQGKLPHPFIESYKDETKMRANFDIILAEAIKAKPNIAQFWTNDNDGTAAFTANGARVGIIWESIGRRLASEGVRYVAPKEGTFGWNQGFVMLKGGKNTEQAYEFIKYMSTPQHSMKWAVANVGLPSAVGAMELLDEESKKFTAAAYPGDAVANIWWWPPQDPWFIKLRSEYADKWRSA